MRPVTTRSVLCVALSVVLLGVSCPAVAGYMDAVLADNPLAYYRLGEASGPTAANLGTTGATNDGTYVGGVGYSAAGALYGDPDTAVSFGADYPDYVITNPFSSFPTTAVSVELWVKCTGSSDGIVSYAATASLNNEVLLYSQTGLVFYADNISKGTGVAVSDDRWHHLVATWRSSDGRMQLFKDGVREYNVTGHQTGFSLDAGGSLVLAQEQDAVGGGFDANQAMPGSLDEVALYDKALSATEVSGHYAAAWDTCVVAGNIAVDDTTHTWTVEDSGPARMTVLSAPNEGDAAMGIGGQAATSGNPSTDGKRFEWREGVMMATVRENGRDGKYGTVEAARDTWGSDSLTTHTTQPGGAELDINVATAFFPFAGCWQAGHVNASGTLVAANGISQSMLTHDATYAGKYTLKIPGVNSLNDGMLFTIGGSSDDRAVGTYLLSDGSGWRINVQDNDSDYGSTVQDDFSFVYMPYWVPNLVGGLIDHNGTVIDGHSVGDFTISPAGTGQYRLTITGKSPDTGMLLLTIADEVSWAASDLPQDNVLSYQAAGSDFIIRASDLPGCGLQNTRFVFAYIDFEDPPFIPEPATLTLLALGGLGMLVRRRRSR